jgi:hypothetical protein
VRARVRKFSDDFLEGDIALYDESGKPCVQIDGFRAISLSGAARAAVPGGRRDLTYHIAWQRTPNDHSDSSHSPVPFAGLHSAARRQSIASSTFAAGQSSRRRFATLMN